MIQLVYIAPLLACFGIIYFLAKNIAKIDISINKINLLNIVFYRDYFVFTIVASFYWLSYSRYEDHYILNTLNPVHFYYAIASSLVFMSIFYISILPFKLIFYSISKKAPTLDRNIYKKYLKLWSLILVVLLIINYKVDVPPFIKLFGDFSPIELATFRYEGSKIPLFNLLRHDWIPCTFYCWAYLYHTENEISSQNSKRISIETVFYMLLMLMCSVASSLWSIEKSLLASFFLGWLGVYLIGKKKHLNLKKLLLIILATLISIFSLYYASDSIDSNDGDVIFLLLETIVTRFFAQSAGVAYAFFVYPDIFDFKYFSGISNLLASITSEKFSSPYGDLIKYADPVNADISGAMSSFVAGEAYGLFGWFGVFLGPVFVAFWYTLFFVMSKNINTAVIFIGQYGLFFGNAYMASSFYSFVWPVGFIYSISPFLLIYLFSRRAK